MPVFNAWIIRALAVRLREPGMRAQRRFTAAAGLVLASFVVGAAFYLFTRPTEDALESAALRVFAAAGLLIAVLVAAAVVVRKRTGAKWSDADALRAAGEAEREGRRSR